ncbi:MAG: hypothetical protein JO051_03325 [Acidobacteriaceae bacterium]|nr:hypothetical protein [Acidobacteriaceae bacterium]
MHNGVEAGVKETALRLLKRGAVTVNEAAEWAMVSRQAVHLWMREAGLKPGRWKKARKAHAAAAFKREYAEQCRRPTKTALRVEAAEAKSAWDWKTNAPWQEG